MTHTRFVWLAIKARCNEDAPWAIAWFAMLAVVAVVMWKLLTWGPVTP